MFECMCADLLYFHFYSQKIFCGYAKVVGKQSSWGEEDRERERERQTEIEKSLSQSNENKLLLYVYGSAYDREVFISIYFLSFKHFVLSMDILFPLFPCIYFLSRINLCKACYNLEQR